MGQLKQWLKEDWVRIGSDGTIKGKCGTSKDKRNPDRCLPRSKANRLSKSERASTARKKKREGSKGRTTVSNTEAAKVRKMEAGGEVTQPKRPFRGKAVKGTAVARGCGCVMPGRRKRTKGSVTQA